MDAICYCPSCFQVSGCRKNNTYTRCRDEVCTHGCPMLDEAEADVMKHKNCKERKHEPAQKDV